MKSHRKLLINRAYARLWLGQAISMPGDFVFSTALTLWVATVLGAGKPWAPAAVSGVILAVGAAVLCVGPLAGVFVDRWNPLRTMLSTELFRAGLVGLLTLLFFVPLESLPVWLWLAVIYLVVFLLNAGSQFFGPARFAIIRDIVPGESDRARAAGIGQATAGAATIIGPPLAAPLLFGIGVQWALLLNAASYAVSFFVIRSVRPRLAAPRDTAPDRRPGIRAEFVAGLRFFAGNRFMLALLTIVLIGQCAMGAVDTVDVFFLTRNLHASPQLYGYLGTALGIGGIIGALTAGRVVQWLGAVTTTWIGSVSAGLLLFAYSRQSSFSSGLFLLFLFAIPLTMLNTALSPLQLYAAPPGYIGRMMSVFNPAAQLSMMIASVTAGWLASSALPNFTGSLWGLHYGTVDLIVSASAILIILTGLYARAVLPDPAAQSAAESTGGVPHEAVVTQTVATVDPAKP